MSPDEAASFAIQLRNARKLAKATKQEIFGYEWRDGSLRPMMRPQGQAKILAEAPAEAPKQPRNRSALASERPTEAQGSLL